MSAIEFYDYRSEAKRHGAMKAMREHIRENRLTCYVSFQEWCDEHNEDWSRALDEWAGADIEKYIADRNARDGRA